jgi:hypothetical protein
MKSSKINIMIKSIMIEKEIIARVKLGETK